MADPTQSGVHRRYSNVANALQHEQDANRMGRPAALKPADEWELYQYRKAGVAIKACASFFRVSVPTVNRIIAKFKAYDERNADPGSQQLWQKVAAATDTLGDLISALPAAELRGEATRNEMHQAHLLMEQATRLLERAVARYKKTGASLAGGAP